MPAKVVSVQHQTPASYTIRITLLQGLARNLVDVTPRGHRRMPTMAVAPVENPLSTGFRACHEVMNSAKVLYPYNVESANPRNLPEAKVIVQQHVLKQTCVP